MATHDAEAQIQGDAAVSAGASAVYASGVGVEGNALLEGDVIGLFWGQWSVLGDSGVLAPGSIAKKAVASLQGDATAFVSDPLYLVTSSVSGDGSIVAPASLAAVAAVSLVGDAGVGATARTALTAASSPSGDASVAASSRVAWKATAPLQGEATLTAAALADDEIAGDLRGRALAAVAATASYAAIGAVEGEADTTAVAMVRKPYVAPEVALSGEVSDRLVGYQPGREAVVREPSYVVDPNPTRRQR